MNSYRSFQQKIKQILFCAIFIFLSSIIFAEPKINCPEIIITGIENEITVSNLHQTMPFQYKLSDGITTLDSNLVNPTQELKIKFSLQRSGINNLIFTAGNEETTFTVRGISGWQTIIPALIAIILALITKQYFLSILTGTFIGILILNEYNPVISFTRFINHYLIGCLANEDYIITILTLVSISGLFGIIYKKGGIKSFTDKFSFCGPVTVQFITWISGLLSIFSDTVGTQAIGISLRELAEKAKISREKFSYIINSTVIPVASLSMLSVWFAVELSLIKNLINDLPLGGLNCYDMLYKTIPYRFYSLLTLFFIFFIINTKKDFGYMLSAEQKFNQNPKTNLLCNIENEYNKSNDDKPNKLTTFFVPLISLMIFTLILIPIDGNIFTQYFKLKTISNVSTDSTVEYKTIKADKELKTITASTKGLPVAIISYNDNTSNVELISNLKSGDTFYGVTDINNISFLDKLKISYSHGNTKNALLWSCILTTIISFLFFKISKTSTVEECVQSYFDGIKTMLYPLAVIMAILCLYSINKDLNTTVYIASYITKFIPYWLLPTIIFTIATICSLLSGSSFGTMTIIMPLAITVALHLNQEKYNADIASLQNATDLSTYLTSALSVNIAAVIEGTVFGTLCSPISPTSIITSVSCEIEHKEHIKTQAPYAALVALVTIIFCFIPAGLGFSPYLLLVIGGMILAGFIMAFGRIKS